MRARSGLMGRCDVSEASGGSRAEGCWTLDARDRMPGPSRATEHHLARIAPVPICDPPARAGSLSTAQRRHSIAMARRSGFGTRRRLPTTAAQSTAYASKPDLRPSKRRHQFLRRRVSGRCRLQSGPGHGETRQRLGSSAAHLTFVGLPLRFAKGPGLSVVRPGALPHHDAYLPGREGSRPC
jgi:hypothetical protein